MGDCNSMPISADSPSDETLNQGPLALLLRRQYEFPFGINIVQFSIYFFFLVDEDKRKVTFDWCAERTSLVQGANV